ncbi:MAG TPA: phosphoribosylformimino-5-aminoimidazole carboxamide ribotide isomerase [Verrucomicrobiae bacterium]|nr:phosphoribosylformimino-5-aminoimidazole carboxamide ribotide isomerase [Verrucomicrobiae bacterium]
MFRPCIDLHEGKVKQIVGGTLGASENLRTNFISEKPAAWFAELYKRDNLRGGHVIMLGAGNENAACSALATFPGGMHIGGGINSANACEWLDAGASHVIVTSWVFREGKVDWTRLDELLKIVGKDKLVIDLSCRRKPLTRPSATLSPPNRERDGVRGAYFVVTDRWQKFTEIEVNTETLRKFSGYCAEFLVHAVDVEGLCRGIDRELVEKLGKWTPIPTTYAAGANSLADLETVTELGQGKVDLTIGSALDIFGGNGVKYEDCVKFNQSRK